MLLYNIPLLSIYHCTTHIYTTHQIIAIYHCLYAAIQYTINHYCLYITGYILWYIAGYIQYCCPTPTRMTRARGRAPATCTGWLQCTTHISDNCDISLVIYSTAVQHLPVWHVPEVKHLQHARVGHSVQHIYQITAIYRWLYTVLLSNTYPYDTCQRSSTCNMHGLVTCRFCCISSSAVMNDLCQGLGTISSSSRCGGSFSFLSSSFSLGSLRTKSTGRKEQNWLSFKLKEGNVFWTHSTHFISNYMASNRINDHLDSGRGNPLPPLQRLFFFY